MQEPLDRVGLVHDTDPGTEARIRETVSETAKHVDHDEHGEGRMLGQNDVGNEVAEGGHDGDAALAEDGVDSGIGEGSDGVADKGGEEDERDDSVSEVIVVLELVEV